MNYFEAPGLISRKDSLDELFNNVCDYFGISVDIIFKKCRKSIVLKSRYIIWYVMYHRMKYNLTDIARIFGMHHTTIINGLKRISDLADTEDITKDELRAFSAFRAYYK